MSLLIKQKIIPSLFTKQKITPSLLVNSSKLISRLINRQLTKNENDALLNYAAGSKSISPVELAYEYIEKITNVPSLQLADPADITENDPEHLNSLLQNLIFESDNTEQLSAEYINYRNKVYQKSILPLNGTGMELVVNETNNINKMGVLDTFTGFIKRMNKFALYKKAYCCLDGRNANYLDNNTRLQWERVIGYNETPDSFNTVNVIRDIVEIKIQSIVIHKFISTMQRATVLFEELQSQSFLAPNGRKFHFVQSLLDLSNSVPVDPRNPNPNTLEAANPSYSKYELLGKYAMNESTYKFYLPITRLESLTMSIGDPFDLVSIPKDRFNNVLLSIDYGHVDSFGEQSGRIILTFNEPHHYPFNAAPTLYTDTATAVYSVFISGFTTSDPVLDASLINEINITEFTMGYWTSATQLTLYPLVVGQPGATDSQIYRIPDPAWATVNGTPSDATVTITGARLVVNMEITYLDGDLVG